MVGGGAYSPPKGALEGWFNTLAYIINMEIPIEMSIAMKMLAINGQEFYVIVKRYMGCKYTIRTMNLLPFSTTPYEWPVFFNSFWK